MKLDRPIRCLFVIPSLITGGAERVLVNLLGKLDRQHFEPYVAVFEKKGELVGELPAHTPIFDLRKKGRWSVLKLIVRLAGIYRRKRIDLVIPFLEFTGILALLARGPGRSKPIIIPTIHNNLREVAEEKRWAAVKMILLRMLYPRADAAVAVSEGVRQDVINRTGISPHRIHVIYNGIDHKKINRLCRDSIPDKEWFAPGDQVIVAGGRLVSQKRLDLVLHALAMIKDRIPARLIILGDGPERSALVKLAHRLQLDQIVRFVGFKSNPYKYFHRSRIFVLSSEWEGFALILLEAMACGTGIIATRCPFGPEELLEDGKSGLLIPVCDHLELAEALITLLTHPERCRRMARNARRRSKHYSVDHMTKQYQNLFLEVSTGWASKS